MSECAHTTVVPPTGACYYCGMTPEQQEQDRKEWRRKHDEERLREIYRRKEN